MSEDYTPPQDLDAERAVLGAMLVSKTAVADVAEILRPEDFYSPAHSTIYASVLDLYVHGHPVDVLTVKDALTTVKEIGRVGGPTYLLDLTGTVTVTQSAAYWARIVADKAVARRYTEAGRRIMQIGYGMADVAAGVDAAQAVLDAAAPTRADTDYRPLGEVLPEALDAVEAAGLHDTSKVVPTGLTDLDDLLGGLHPGQMVVVAGRPSMGKSVLAVDLARSAAITHGLPAVVFSLEMGRQELTHRILAAEAKVPLSHLRHGHMEERDWARLATVVNGPLASAPLWIDDSPNLTMTDIRAKARRLHREHGLRLVVIDYLQLMRSGVKVESRQLEVSEFSRQIKVLAKELEVPVVALSQLNRGPEQRADKRPMLSDLRESGSVEQDADVVILLHRPDYYEMESDRPGEADLIVAKHRNGATRDVAVAFQGHYSRFVNMAAGL